MNIEENVDVKETQTEEQVEKEKVAVGAAKQTDERASTVLGKFKDVDALARAYEALQAEFTRRSQKLRSLEREVDNFKRSGGASGAEKLRKTANFRREATKAFDAFVAAVDANAVKEKPAFLETAPQTTAIDVAKGEACLENGSAEVASATVNSAGISAIESSSAASLTEETPFRADILPQTAEKAAEGARNAVQEVAKAESLRGVEQEGSVEEKGKVAQTSDSDGDAGRGEVLLSAVGSEGELLSSEALFQRAIADEGVRLHIVGEYLQSLGSSGVTLTSGKKGVLTTPPKRAATVGQAGNMALSYFRKPTVD